MPVMRRVCVWTARAFEREVRFGCVWRDRLFGAVDTRTRDGAARTSECGVRS